MVWKRAFGLCLVAMLLSSCGRIGQGTSDYCRIAKPIFVSKDDMLTDGTARQILEHDLTGHGLCGWNAARA
jgi:hypothetical protein